MSTEFLDLNGLKTYNDKVNAKLAKKVDKTAIEASLTSDDDDKVLAASQGKALNTKITTASTTASTNKADIAKIKTDYIPNSLKGAHSGLAMLDANGKLVSSQMPDGMDTIVEYAARANFPATGEAHYIYLALDTNISYRWSGSTYVQLDKTIGIGETATSAYAGIKGKANRDDIETLKTGKLDATSIITDAEINALP